MRREILFKLGPDGELSLFTTFVSGIDYTKDFIGLYTEYDSLSLTYKRGNRTHYPSSSIGGGYSSHTDDDITKNS